MDEISALRKVARSRGRQLLFLTVGMGLLAVALTKLDYLQYTNGNFAPFPGAVIVLSVAGGAMLWGLVNWMLAPYARVCPHGGPSKIFQKRSFLGGFANLHS